MLHLVGVTQGLDSQKASRRGAKGALKNVGHGIYCDPGDMRDVSEFTRTNAIRIANYLYPQSALSHASAYFNGPVLAEDSTPSNPHYKLFLCGPYHKIRHFEELGLTIVQYDTMANQGMKRFCDGLSDGKELQYGEMKLLRFSDELVFLQNFGRGGSHGERFLSEKDLVDLRERLEGAYGDKLMERLSYVVQQCHDFGRELEKAFKTLSVPLDEHRRRVILTANPNAVEYTIGWSGREVAKLVQNGSNWSFNYVDGWKVQLHSDEVANGRSPAFINNLFPEGTMREMLFARMSKAGPSPTLLEQSHRYMSNISIVRDPQLIKKLPIDALEVSLTEHCDKQGLFCGRVRDLPPLGPSFLMQASDTLCRIDMTRIAGMQAKIGMNLSYDGDLVPAINLPTTHILKLPGIERDSRNIKGVVEWVSMSLAEGSGMPCAKSALVELPGSPNVLGFISERFDIPQSEDDMRMIFAEDLCTLMGMAPEAKGMPMLNDVARRIKEQSTDWKADGEEFFRLIFVNYVLENADFHTKNASLIKIARPMLDGIRSVRMAPAYDIMRTAYFTGKAALPPGEREPMQLGYIDDSGHFVDSDFDHKRLMALAKMCDVSEERATEIMRDCAYGISKKAHAIASDLPRVLRDEQYVDQREVVIDVLRHAVASCHDFFPELPAKLDVHTEAKQSASQKRAGVTA